MDEDNLISLGSLVNDYIDLNFEYIETNFKNIYNALNSLKRKMLAPDSKGNESKFYG